MGARDWLSGHLIHPAASNPPSGKTVSLGVTFKYSKRNAHLPPTHPVSAQQDGDDVNSHRKGLCGSRVVLPLVMRCVGGLGAGLRAHDLFACDDGLHLVIMYYNKGRPVQQMGRSTACFSVGDEGSMSEAGSRRAGGHPEASWQLSDLRVSSSIRNQNLGCGRWTS